MSRNIIMINIVRLMIIIVIVRAQFDEDQDGKLSTTELARLCHSLGTKLTHSELEGAIMALDINRDGYIQVRRC
jgi:hypothetical protein